MTEPHTPLLPVSFQENLMLSALEAFPDNPGWNIARLFEIKGIFSASILERTFHLLFHRHEILRTRFDKQDGRYVRTVLSETDWKVEYRDLRDLESSERGAVAQELISRWRRMQFDVTKPPHVFAGLIRIKQNRYYLFTLMSHLVIDGWSSSLLTREAALIYLALLFRRRPKLPELPGSPSSYAQWQQNDVCAENRAEHRFWQRVYESFTALHIPFDLPAPVCPTHEAGVSRMMLRNSEILGMNRLKRECGISDAYLLTTLFQIVLHLFTKSNHTGIQFIVSNRFEKQYIDMLALLAVGIPYSIEIDPQQTIMETLTKWKDYYRESIRNTPYHRKNIFTGPRIQFNYYDGYIDEQYNKPLRIGLTTLQLNPNLLSFYMFSACSQYFIVRKLRDGFEIMQMYQKDWYKEETMKRLLDSFALCVKSAAKNPYMTIQDLGLHIHPTIHATSEFISQGVDA